MEWIRTCNGVGKMDTAIIVALISLFGTIISPLIIHLINKKKTHEDDQSAAIELLMRSQWFILHGLQQLKNEETGEPLINGESHDLQREIEKWQIEQVKKSLK